MLARKTATVDRGARLLLQAADADLRRHLGVSRLSLDLVGELYARVRDLLDEAEAGVEPAGGEPLADALALQIYLVVVADEVGSGAGPDLLASLRRTLAARLPRTGMSRDRGSSEERRE